MATTASTFVQHIRWGPIGLCFGIRQPNHALTSFVSSDHRVIIHRAGRLEQKFHATFSRFRANSPARDRWLVEKRSPCIDHVAETSFVILFRPKAAWARSIFKRYGDIIL